MIIASPLRYAVTDQGLSPVNNAIQYANADGTTACGFVLPLRYAVFDRGLSMINSTIEYTDVDGTTA
jgi:hypothetical protein